jgi:pentose-5-phosphate-3-epimerase
MVPCYSSVFNPGFVVARNLYLSSLNKLREVWALFDASGREIRLEIDGGGMC